jgi:hypothetical protein
MNSKDDVKIVDILAYRENKHVGVFPVLECAHCKRRYIGSLGKKTGGNHIKTQVIPNYCPGCGRHIPYNGELELIAQKECQNAIFKKGVIWEMEAKS